MSLMRPIGRRRAKKLVEECVNDIELVEYAHTILSNVDQGTDFANQTPDWIRAFRKWEKLAGYSPVR